MIYQTVERIFLQGHAELSAAEAHGMAVGMLCANDNARSSDWLAELFGDDKPADDEISMLLDWFDQSEVLLDSDQFEFELFLPDENTRLTERANALADWCRGFLFGFGSQKKASTLSGESKEILKDVYEFSHMDPQADGEEDEAAFIELTEYVKAAVLLLRSEITLKPKRVVH